MTDRALTLEEKKERLGNLFRKQIEWIQLHGCNKIKCKNCALQGICPHEPSKAKDAATFVILKAQGIVAEKERRESDK